MCIRDRVTSRQQSEGNKKKSRSQEKKCRNHKGYGIFSSVPSMALILLVKVQSRVFTAKCSEPQVGTSNGMDAVSYTHLDVYKRQVQDQPG